MRQFKLLIGDFIPKSVRVYTSLSRNQLRILTDFVTGHCGCTWRELAEIIKERRTATTKIIEATADFGTRKRKPLLRELCATQLRKSLSNFERNDRFASALVKPLKISLKPLLILWKYVFLPWGCMSPRCIMLRTVMGIDKGVNFNQKFV